MKESNTNAQSLHQSLKGIESDANTTHSLHEFAKALKPATNESKPLKIRGHDIERFDTLSKLIYNTPLKHTLVVVSTLMLFLVAWNAQSSIFLAQGLDFDSLEIGIFMAYTGVVLLVYTWFIQPIFLRKFSHRPFYIINSILMIFVVIGFPSLIWLPYNEINDVYMVIIASFVGGWKFVFAVSMFVLAQVFVNNSVPSDSIGRANGIAQSIQSLFRGVGPILVGSVWSWSIAQDSKAALYAAYIVLFVFEFFPTIWMLIFLKNDIMLPYEVRMKTIENGLNDMISNETELTTTTLKKIYKK